MNARGQQDSDQPVLKQQSTQDSIRETIDSIVVAFILAFVFRAFIVEAFVIPTGSMASTLNGAHGTMICHNCGWQWAYGLTDPMNRGRGHFVDGNRIIICPNCRYPNHPLEINDAKGNQESGDRILVLKWPYDLHTAALGPERWSVVVFKDPSDGKTNYIKRLVGMPGEVLQIVDGDVYSVPLSELSDETLATLDGLRHAKYLRRVVMDLERGRLTVEDLSEELIRELGLREASDQSGLRKIEREIQRLERELREPFMKALEELDAKLNIQRKTDLAQESLWRVVYDHDYPPQDRNPDQPFWLPDPGADSWNVGNRTLRFEGPDAPEQTVRLSAQIDNFCAYNDFDARGPLVPVSDLRIAFVLAYESGDGAIRARLTKRADVFAGELAADGTVRILRASAEGGGDWKELATARVEPLRPGQAIEYALQNLDYRVSLRLNGEEVIATTAEEYSPDVRALRRSQIPITPPPAVVAHDLTCTLSHVVVENDVYYLSRYARESSPLNYAAWGTENNPIMLRPGEFFMLGDNSAQSKDSRLWDVAGDHLLPRGEEYQLGTVPRDQLIGRAFFVYWPSGLRTSLIPFLKDRGWIPNFGRMRWIR